MGNPKDIRLLDGDAEYTPPAGHGGMFGTLSVDVLPVDLATTTVDIDLVGAEPSLALPEVTAGPEEEDNRKR